MSKRDLRKNGGFIFFGVCSETVQNSVQQPNNEPNVYEASMDLDLGEASALRVPLGGTAKRSGWQRIGAPLTWAEARDQPPRSRQKHS